jgi:hypothetical protein
MCEESNVMRTSLFATIPLISIAIPPHHDTTPLSLILLDVFIQKRLRISYYTLS